MNKKEYLLKLMQILPADVVSVAPNLLSLLEWNQLSNQLIDVFYKIFHEYALTIKDKKKKETLNASMLFLEKLKEVEWEENIQDEKDIIDLENLLKNI